MWVMSNLVAVLKFYDLPFSFISDKLKERRSESSELSKENNNCQKFQLKCPASGYIDLGQSIDDQNNEMIEECIKVPHDLFPKSRSSHHNKTTKYTSFMKHRQSLLNKQNQIGDYEDVEESAEKSTPSIDDILKFKDDEEVLESSEEIVEPKQRKTTKQLLESDNEDEFTFSTDNNDNNDCESSQKISTANESFSSAINFCSGTFSETNSAKKNESNNQQTASHKDDNIINDIGEESTNPEIKNTRFVFGEYNNTFIDFASKIIKK